MKSTVTIPRQVLCDLQPLREAREARRVTLPELANLAEVHPVTLSRALAGKQKVSAALLERLCDLLDVPRESVLLVSA